MDTQKENPQALVEIGADEIQYETEKARNYKCNWLSELFFWYLNTTFKLANERVARGQSLNGILRIFIIK